MARKVRIEYEGAVYHVMARGNRREAICRDDTDRQEFLSLLGQVCDKTGWLIHAYVMMGNHYHLMLETPDANLVAGMKWFQSTYTTRYNNRHRVVGHLFQGRYKAIVVEAEKGFFRRLAEYIHLNPARAGMIRGGAALESYLWSSYPHYLRRPGKRPLWLVAEEVLSASGFADSLSGRREYREWMESKVREERGSKVKERYQEIRRGWYFGEEGFGENLLGWLESSRKKTHEAGVNRDMARKTAGEILFVGLSTFDLDVERLPELPKSDIRKQIIAHFIRKYTSVSLDWIGQALHMGHASRVSRYCSRIGKGEYKKGARRALLRMERKLEKKLNRIES